MFLFSGENEKCLEARDCRYVLLLKTQWDIQKTQVNRIEPKVKTCKKEKVK